MKKRVTVLILALILLLELLPTTAFAFNPENFKANITKISIGKPITGIDGKKKLPVTIHFTANDDLDDQHSVFFLEGIVKALLANGTKTEGISGLGMTLQKVLDELKSNQYTWEWNNGTGTGVLKYDMPLLDKGEAQTVEQSQATGQVEVNGLKVGDSVTVQIETVMNSSVIPEEILPPGGSVRGNEVTFKVEDESAYPKEIVPGEETGEENLGEVTSSEGLVEVDELEQYRAKFPSVVQLLNGAENAELVGYVNDGYGEREPDGTQALTQDMITSKDDTGAIYKVPGDLGLTLKDGDEVFIGVRWKGSKSKKIYYSTKKGIRLYKKYTAKALKARKHKRKGKKSIKVTGGVKIYAPYKKFKSASFMKGGQSVPLMVGEDCTVVEGSTVIELTDEFAVSLEPGEYEMLAEFEDGEATWITVVTEEEDEESDDLIIAFITRCYRIILGREPDEGGLQTWFDELSSKRKTASEIIDRFVNSPEFTGKNYSNGDQVDILYQAMLGRNADAAGKENWVKKLENGQTLAHVINGFCFSNEFRGLCATYGIKAGFVNIQEDHPTAEGKIKAFVTRCYRIILDREADASGLQTWYNELSSRRKAASEIIDRFVNSPEYLGKNYSNEESVEILYKAMLGRSPDAAGKANWVAKLDAGQPFAVVINGFCNSAEFKGICESYGIEPGSVKVNQFRLDEPISRTVVGQEDGEETASAAREIILTDEYAEDDLDTAVMVLYYSEEKVTEFVARCYRSILERDAGAGEMAQWTEQVLNGAKTPDQIIRGFLFSDEFKNKDKSNEELVRILYRVYMNREADPEGLATWAGKLDSGMTLKELADIFAKTNEFRKLLGTLAD